MSRRQLAAVVLVGLLTFVTLTVMDAVTAQAAAQGDTGTEVTAIQTALRGFGYTIAVDGDFGPQTLRAVTHFQRANALTPDGIAGPLTSRAMGLAQAQRGTQTQVNAPQPPSASPYSAPCQEFHALLGFFSPGWDVERMANIMHRESRCQPGARNGSGAAGLLQIMPLHVPNLAPCGVYSASDLLDASKNICSAAIVYRRAGGMSPWAQTR